MSQSNTRVGDVRLEAGVDLRGKEGRLVKLGASDGRTVASLPGADTDPALFVVIEGADVGELVSLRPLEPGRNVRVRLQEDCNPGDVLVLADLSVSADAGMVRPLPTETGSYRGHLVAEEVGVEGQLVLARPAFLGVLTV
jgi:hypothetical protein